MAVRALPSANSVSGTGRLLHEWVLSPDRYWPWGEHRVGGAAVLPGTAFLEFFVQAGGEARPLALESILLSDPLTAADGETHTLRVRRDGDALVLQSEGPSGLRDHARARFAQASEPDDLLPLAEIEARCPGQAEFSRIEQGIQIATGPRWQVQINARCGDDEALARVTLPPACVADLEQHPLHPALLDVAISFYLALLEGGSALLPWRYDRLQVFAPLTRSLVSHVRLRSRSGRTFVLDADVRDATGRLLVRVEGYTLVQVASPSAGPRPALPANPFAITPAEGIEVFRRVLGLAEPVVSISTVDWNHAMAVTSPVTQAAPANDSPAAVPSDRKPRPENGTAFRPPGTTSEKLLAEVWAEVLGFDRIGADDDLVELGADSLSALQAAARVKELGGSEFPMERFFSRPTVAHLAETLEVSAAAPAAPTAGPAWEEGQL
jgi:acyl carrier protein